MTLLSSEGPTRGTNCTSDELAQAMQLVIVVLGETAGLSACAAGVEALLGMEGEAPAVVLDTAVAVLQLMLDNLVAG